MSENPSFFQKILAWRKCRRYALQVAALIAAVLASFGIFFALSAGLNGLAVGCFTLLAASMLITAWAG